MFIRIYALAVCFASMMCIAISSGIALYDLIQITAPQITVDRYAFTMRAEVIQSAGGFLINQQTKSAEPLSEQQIAAEQERQFNMAVKRERSGAMSSLLQIFTVLVVSFPLYWVHWRLAKRLESSQAESPQTP